MLRLFVTAGCTATATVFYAKYELHEAQALQPSNISIKGPPPELSDLKLRNVQVFMRHGARTPIKVLPYLQQASWPVEHLMADPPGLDKFAYRVRDLRGDSLPMGLYETSQRNVIFQGGCFPGQLTSPGKQQLYDLGQRLRKEYVDEKKLIPGIYNANDIYIRSTNITRTIESAVWLVSGLFGIQKSDSRTPNSIEIFATTDEEEILYPNFMFCNDLGRLMKRVSQHIHEIAGLLEDREILEKALQFDHVNNKGRMNFLELRDEVTSRVAHGLPIEPILEEWFDKIDHYAVEFLVRMISGTDKTADSQQDILKLTAGPVFELILNNMYGVLHRKNRFKLEVYSCHDTTMIALLLVLSLFNGKWPPYAADLRFELLEDGKTGHLYVQVKYLGAAQSLTGVEGETAFGSKLYPLDDFSRRFAELAVSQRHHRDLCDQRRPHAQPIEGRGGDDEASYFTMSKAQALPQQK
ncbi:Lysophosphatidic acid phosphatase type 6 [Hypsibius exemplaris]|uniref:Lysophosphatidic acid phosphatase type 6 n=1 Tax=Hypsibius exemplaris TaxID=2072580 RepID=A0A1W0XFH2_HYPEX|nr:Lysophosphatidic acid phosphatase type 6 [Hypsibius exemplaris]